MKNTKGHQILVGMNYETPVLGAEQVPGLAQLAALAFAFWK